MDLRQAFSSPSNFHDRRARPPQRKNRRKPKQNSYNDSTNYHHTQGRAKRDSALPPVYKEAILNGFESEIESSLSSYPLDAIEGARTFSSRNIIAEHFNFQASDKQASRTNYEPTKASSLNTTDSEDEDRRKGPLKYNDMINEDIVSGDILPFMRRFGLDDARFYTELRSDYFIQIIREHSSDILYCTLCCHRERIQRDYSIDFHLSSRKHVDLFLQLRSKLLNLTPHDNSVSMISLQHLMRTWYEENSLNIAQTQARMMAVSDFCAALAEIDSSCHCRIIGSFYSGTSLQDSDVNLELVHPNSKLFLHDPRAKNSIHHKLVNPEADYGNQINNHTMHYDLISNAVETLHKIAMILIRGYSSVKTFTLKSTPRELTRKVPKLVLHHIHTNVTLEVWCYAQTSFRLGGLLRNYLWLDERALQLSILVKHWARICQISNPKQGTLTPETFIILVIHYLQRVEPPVLPCLHKLLNKDSEKTKNRQNSNLVDKLHELNLDNSKFTQDCDDEENGTVTADADLLEDELDDDEEADMIDYEFEAEAIEQIQWLSKNTDPVHKLFIGFLKFSISEFAKASTVISIRTLDTIRVEDKAWNTQVKAIENPVRPSLNLAKSIGSMRTFEYIKECFKHGYYYLTSIPMVSRLRRLADPPPDPTGYVKLFLNLDKFDFYFEMKKDLIKEMNRGRPKQIFIDEMIGQDLFARDVEVIKELIEHFISHRRNLNSIPATVARNYDPKFLIPHDTIARVFCWLCRSFGHDMEGCPRRTVFQIHDDEIVPKLDEQVNLDEGFLQLYVDDMIRREIAYQHEQVVRELTEAIREGTGYNCELKLFGSTVNLLGSIDSDLDICMTLKDNPNGRGVDCVKILKETHKVLLKNEHVDEHSIETIFAARVPIIKFKYDSFDVDLSMYNQCAIHNSMLLRSYVLIDFRLAQLFFLVKQYAKSCGIADASKGTLSSYAWSLMVIHFLQHTNPPILPVLQEPSGGGTKPVLGVNGWNVWFNESMDMSNRPKNDANLTMLFKQFLLYYTKFDFTQNVVSIRTSRFLTKFQKNWTNCMMAIEDPFELTYNLPGRLDDLMAIYIMNSFARTYRHIRNFQLDVRKRSLPINADNLRKLFNGYAIMASEPPYRGCRRCHRIGHRVAECSNKLREQRLKSRKDEESQ